MKRKPRRANDRDGREIGMSLANMREHGVRSVEATCGACKHETVINVDSLPDDLYVPDLESDVSPVTVAHSENGHAPGMPRSPLQICSKWEHR